MFSSRFDRILVDFSAAAHRRRAGAAPGRLTETARGALYLQDTGGEKPCVVLVPDGPNVVAHYEQLIKKLSMKYRVVCFDMPGSGHSLPPSDYGYTLDEGAATVIAVLDALHIRRAVLAFSCANGLYAIRVAQIAPSRVESLVLSQTPSLLEMHAWSKRIVPRVLHIPVFGQLVGWLGRNKAAFSWYRIALSSFSKKNLADFQQPGMHSLANGGCFCLAGIVQGLGRDDPNSLRGISAPCLMLWGPLDRSHKPTNPMSLKDIVPHAEIIEFESSGHFPDLEESDRFATILLERAPAAA